MSTDYFIACHECRRITPIASASAISGWKWFCSPDMGPVWFMAAHEKHCERLGIVREQSSQWDTYEHGEMASEDEWLADTQYD